MLLQEARKETTVFGNASRCQWLVSSCSIAMSAAQHPPGAPFKSFSSDLPSAIIPLPCTFWNWHWRLDIKPQRQLNSKLKLKFHSQLSWWPGCCGARGNSECLKPRLDPHTEEEAESGISAQALPLMPHGSLWFDFSYMALLEAEISPSQSQSYFKLCLQESCGSSNRFFSPIVPLKFEFLYPACLEFALLETAEVLGYRYLNIWGSALNT